MFGSVVLILFINKRRTFDEIIESFFQVPSTLIKSFDDQYSHQPLLYIFISLCFFIFSREPQYSGGVKFADLTSEDGKNVTTYFSSMSMVTHEKPRPSASKSPDRLSIIVKKKFYTFQRTLV